MVTPAPSSLRTATVGRSFADFNNAYANRRCTIVGRGPTEFDYNQLASATDPIFFLNDAICLESIVLNADTFLFAHDLEVIERLSQSTSGTIVVPDLARSHVGLHDGSKLITYRVRDSRCESLLFQSRHEIASENELYTHSGTIHSLLHFIWFCGFVDVTLIGCDGINNCEQLRVFCGSADGYDPRLANHSCTQPAWNYQTIRQVQDSLASLLQLNLKYLGTPTICERALTNCK